MPAQMALRIHNSGDHRVHEETIVVDDMQRFQSKRGSRNSATPPLVERSRLSHQPKERANLIHE